MGTNRNISIMHIASAGGYVTFRITAQTKKENNFALDVNGYPSSFFGASNTIKLHSACHPEWNDGGNKLYVRGDDALRNLDEVKVPDTKYTEILSALTEYNACDGDERNKTKQQTTQTATAAQTSRNIGLEKTSWTARVIVFKIKNQTHRQDKFAVDKNGLEGESFHASNGIVIISRGNIEWQVTADTFFVRGSSKSMDDNTVCATVQNYSRILDAVDEYNACQGDERSISKTAQTAVKSASVSQSSSVSKPRIKENESAMNCVKCGTRTRQLAVTFYCPNCE